jgi:hypothetical protein
VQLILILEGGNLETIKQTLEIGALQTDVFHRVGVGYMLKNVFRGQKLKAER